MAKGQITENELTGGLKGLSVLGSLSGTAALKDSPFRDSRTEPRMMDVVRPVETPKPAEVPTPQEMIPAAQSVTTTRAHRAEGKGAASKPKTASRAQKQTSTEKVGVFMSPLLRDRIDGLARELQRSRPTKGERITGNSVIRAAVRLVLDNFEFSPADAPSNEEELFELLNRRCSWK